MSRFSHTSKSSLLKDNSWIRKPDDEDEDIDRDPNFAKSVLSHYRSSDSIESAGTEEIRSTKTTTRSTSVQALTKRFSTSQDELRSSTLPSSGTTSSYTKSSYSSLKSDYPRSTTTTVTEEPKTSTTTTKVTKDGKTTETTITTTQRSNVIKSPTKTETFSERVMASSKGPLYSTYTPKTTVTSSKDAEDKLYDTLIPSAIKGDVSQDSRMTISTTESVLLRSSDDTDAEDKLYGTLIPSSIRGDFSPTDSQTISSTETVTVKSSTNGDIKTTTTTRTSTSAEDDLYGTLLPKAITNVSPISSSSIRETITVESTRGVESSPPSTRRTSSYSSYTDEYPSTRTSSYTISTKPSDDYSSKSYSSYEYSSVTSPSTYTTTTYRSSSRSDDGLSDPIYSKSSIKSVYGAPERTVLEKDLCTSCRKPFTGDAKIVLDEMKINCHANCFKCEVCNGSLGHLKAGDSMWIYRRMVHCENCFEVTKDKWRH